MYAKLMNESLKALIDNRKALFKALIIPTILLFILDSFFPNTINNVEFIFENDSQSIVSILLLVVFTFINALIAVWVHRIILLKDDISLQRSIIPTKRELNFFLKSFFLGLLIGFVAIVVFFLIGLVKNLIPDYAFIVVFFLALLFLAFLISRFSMVFPSIAIDEKFDFGDAWVFTQNYKILCLFMIIIFPIMISVLITVVYGLIIGFLVGVVSSYFAILYVFLNIFITVLVISCLSVTYSYIKEENSKKLLENESIEGNNEFQ